MSETPSICALLPSKLACATSWELLDREPQAYKDQVLPPGVTARVCVEQASTMGWHRYAGRTGHVIGMSTFGASAPLKDLQKKFGFDPANVVAAARAQLTGKAS